MAMSTARRLGQHCRIVLASLSAEKNRERQVALAEDGIDAVAVTCDITSPADVGRLAEAVSERGRLRILAHVSALSPVMGDWRTLFKVNLLGAFLVERAMLELAQQATAAVFVSSSAGHGVTPTPELTAVLDRPLEPDFLDRLEALEPEINSTLAYGLSKFALMRMCRRRAAAWGRRGARIVSMSPGLIATPQGAREFLGPNRERKLERLAGTPLGREGTMIETADAIEFLTSDRASFITGVDLLVDGGVVAAMQYPEGSEI